MKALFYEFDFWIERLLLLLGFRFQREVGGDWWGRRRGGHSFADESHLHIQNFGSKPGGFPGWLVGWFLFIYFDGDSTSRDIDETEAEVPCSSNVFIVR